MSFYKQDPNNTEKQVIKTGASRAQKFPARKAILPSKEIIYNRPDAVLINNTGSYAFLYATTGSVGGNAPAAAVYGAEPYKTGSIINAANAYQGNITPTQLDINPVAWIRTDLTGATGDITFIYNGKFKRGPE